MSRLLPPGMQGYLSGGACTDCLCWRVDAPFVTTQGFTDHNRDVIFDGITYQSITSFSASAIEDQAGFAVSNLELLGGQAEDSINDDDVRAGRYDGATIRIYLVNWANPTMRIVLRKGSLGQVTSGDLSFRAELRGLGQRFQQYIGTLSAQKCRARENFGGTGIGLNDGCRYPINPPLWTANTAEQVKENNQVLPTTPTGWQFEIFQAGTTGAVEPSWPNGPDGQQVNDGTVIWKARRAIIRAGTVTAVTDRSHFTVGGILGDYANNTGGALAGGFFTFGTISFKTPSKNHDIPVEIAASATVGVSPAGVAVAMVYPYPFDIQVGDTLTIKAGCDGMVETCRDRYRNLNNFRAEPYRPGTDQLFRVNSE